MASSADMLPDEAETIADFLSTVFLDDSLEQYDANFTGAETRRGQELYEQLGCRRAINSERAAGTSGRSCPRAGRV